MDRYRILKQLGSGATAKVYLAGDMHLDRPVAIKEMEYSKEKMREVELLKQISHKGLPKIYDCYVENGILFLVMEYVEGMTLRDYLKKNGPMCSERAVQCLKELSDIFIFLHNSHPSIIYRDLKPENVILCTDGKAKLIDLGAACCRDYCDESYDGCGTRGYSAPEVFKGTKAEKAEDIYSLGVLLYELLTGIGPNEARSVREKLRQIDKAFHPGLEKIIEKCTRKEPDMRFRSVEEFREAITKYKRYGSITNARTFLKKAIVGLSYTVAFMSVASPIIKEGWQGYGIRELEFTLVILGISMLLQMVLILKPLEIGKVKCEKEIFLTQKNHPGLWVIIGMLIGAGALLEGLEIRNSCMENVPKEEMLWVDLKDSSYRNVLIRDDGVYEVTDKLRFEISKEDIPEEETSIYLVADTDDGMKFTSRQFKVKSSDKIEKSKE